MEQGTSRFRAFLPDKKLTPPTVFRVILLFHASNENKLRELDSYWGLKEREMLREDGMCFKIEQSVV